MNDQDHLDAESVEWLEQFLVRFPGSRGRRHPRPATSSTTPPNWILELDRATASVEGQLFFLAGAEGSAAGD